MRVQDKVFHDIKAKLGQGSLPTYLIKGLPSDYIEDQVEEFCSKISWTGTVDANSRRFRNHRLQWVVRASSPPPTFSTYCFTGSLRFRIDTERAIRTVSPSRPPPVALEEFQTQTFAQQALRLKSSGRRPEAPTYAQVAARRVPLLNLNLKDSRFHLNLPRLVEPQGHHPLPLRRADLPARPLTPLTSSNALREPKSNLKTCSICFRKSSLIWEGP